MRVALVHDYLSQDGGAERVLFALHKIWPEAPIFVLFHDKGKIGYIPSEVVHESFFSHLPLVKKVFQWYLPFMPMATERHHLSDYDVVISSSSIFAKGVITAPTTLHISYCHTPARFLWADGHNYLSELKSGRFVKSILPLIIHRLRLWDQMSTTRVDRFIANSHTVRQRIWKYYRRDSVVIHPPVDSSLFHVSDTVGDYFLAGGRLVPYKRLDLVIKVFNRLGLKLKIFGSGPELRYLKSIAKNNIEFLGTVSEAEKAHLMAKARAFIHPQLEDFGITPIESMAAGRPVIAYAQGGATETLTQGITGVFFSQQTWESLYNAVINFDHTTWDKEAIRAKASQYSPDVFSDQVKQAVSDLYEEFRQGFDQCPISSRHKTI